MLNDTILEHFRNPHNAGNLDDATAVVEVTNPVCGDTMRLSVGIDGGRIREARFKTQGCVASIAAGSVLTELLIGKSLNEARAITTATISDSLGGLPPTTMHAAELALDAVAALLEQMSREPA
ncbi:MAG: iron-sulfur cluster assembly scaffold protein [Candidatus Acidiferrales bacterium]